MWPTALPSFAGFWRNETFLALGPLPNAPSRGKVDITSMFTQPETIEFSLPAWVAGFAASHAPLLSVDERMAFVIEASRRNVDEGTGGPFAAAVFERDSGRLVSLGVNLVVGQGLSILHAEVVAIAIAQKKVGSYDLGCEGILRHEIVASAEPCAMCLGVLHWSGVSRIVTGATESDARSIGFDEGPKRDDWRAAFADRQIEVIEGIRRADARAVMEHYLRSGGPIYNARRPR